MINERMQQLINVLSNGNIRAFSQLVGVKPTVIENIVGVGKGKPGYELLEKIAFVIENINMDWLSTGRGFMLLTGEGLMLRADGVPTLSITPSMDISTLPDTVLLRLIDKLDQKDYLLKEKESKIDHLQTRLRQQFAELAALEVKYSQYKDKESHLLSMYAITETFTSEPLKDYRESSIPMKRPTSSKISSAGKT